MRIVASPFRQESPPEGELEEWPPLAWQEGRPGARYQTIADLITTSMQETSATHLPLL